MSNPQLKSIKMDGEPDVIAINEGEVKSLTTKRDLFNVAVKKFALISY